MRIRMCVVLGSHAMVCVHASQLLWQASSNVLAGPVEITMRPYDVSLIIMYVVWFQPDWEWHNTCRSKCAGGGYYSLSKPADPQVSRRYPPVPNDWSPYLHRAQAEPAPTLTSVASVWSCMVMCH